MCNLKSKTQTKCKFIREDLQLIPGFSFIFTDKLAFCLCFTFLITH